MNSPEKPIAHVTENGNYHLLNEHLEKVSELAGRFAVEFGAGEWARLAGRWHDLGKYSPKFQSYIRAANKLDGEEAHVETMRGRVDHSTAGALNAIETFDVAGRLFAYLIAGHHAGLPDWESDTTGSAALGLRLRKANLLSDALEGGIPCEILDRTLPVERPKPGSDPALWIRMLFSCVVDADFLDTEAFFELARADLRGNYPELSELEPLFTPYMKRKMAAAANTEVNRIRADILSQCIAKSSEPPGIYTLTVPTGGGKTLSSMAFALRHAIKYQKRRIIYVIPYTSIIEQTADQFRKIFAEAVIEHHSNLDVADPAKDNARSRLACENWDAPIIVTTSVQFFESLFASRTSRCRKLHNLINSVVILDEAQLLPPEFLNPILFVLAELQKNYNVTLLLSTATQPAFDPQPAFHFDGLPGSVELMDDPLELHNQLKRVEVTIPQDLLEPRSWGDLATELAKHRSVLCIVNRRDDCRELWEKMPEGTFHLSALMCGAHRSNRINEIRERLEELLPTRVISTQLVEAGVDLDFPVVYRALCGLDSVAQAAGRCNREGLLEKGTVIVFIPPSTNPIGYLRQTAEIGRRMLTENCEDVLSPERFKNFFKEFYWLQGERLDRNGILSDLKMSEDLRCSFRTAASKFHLIDEASQAPVIVDYGEGAKMIRMLEKDPPKTFPETGP